MRKSFTLLEIIFVVAIIAVLTSVVISKSSFSFDRVNLIKLRSEISLIRSAIAEDKNRAVLKNSSKIYIDSLDEASVNKSGEKLFCGLQNRELLNIDIYSANENEKQIGRWIKISQNGYGIWISSSDYVEFTYDPDNGRFECNEKNEICKKVNY